MKKQLLILFSTLFLLTGCGQQDNSSEEPSSSVTSNTSESSEATSSSSSTPVEPAKIDVTIKVTASGIDEYTGNHSKLYINSNFDCTDPDQWLTHEMTQSTEDNNIWTYTFSQIEVESRYKYNIIYGSDEEPDWTNGFNKEGSGDEPITVTITEDKTVYEVACSFNIPTTKHTFKLVLTPHIKTSKDAEDEAFNSDTYVWMWCSLSQGSENMKLTKDETGNTWTYQVTDYVGDAFQFTPTLGTSAAANWTYQYGAYKDDGTWEKWEKASSIDLTGNEESYSYDVCFNGQPAEPSADVEKVDVTFKVTASGINEYTGSHSKLYINSNLDSTEWSTHEMTQSTEDNNVWTCAFSQVAVGNGYEFNIYYGNDTEANWTNGKNSEVDRTVDITKDKTVYEFTSTFSIPTVKHTFTLVLTPHIQTTKGTDDAFNSDTYVWMWCSSNSEAKLTKDETGNTWTYQVTDFEGDSFKFTPTLGSESAIAWTYQYGTYNDETWENGNGVTIALVENQTSYSYDVYFNGQPAEPSADVEKVDVTFKVTASGINEYTGSHSKLYINSNLDSTEWSTHEMTQSTEDNNVWTCAFSQVAVGNGYEFNIYYGNDTEANWTNGKNSEVDRTVDITKDKTTYEFTSTFSIPEESSEESTDTFSVTLHYSADSWDYTSELQVVYKINDGNEQWVKMVQDKTDESKPVYDLTITGIPNNATFKYHLYTWKDNCAHTLVADAEGSDFVITVTSNLRYNITGDFSSAAGSAVGIATLVTSAE